MINTLPQNAVIGILGGGQLGRMLSVAAARLGYRTHISEPSPNPPAGQVAQYVTTASYEDTEALRRFAAQVDVITYEFENIPADALDILQQNATIFPSRKALAVSQDRIDEKNFLTKLGLKTAPYRNVESAQDLQSAITQIGTPAILKTRRFGYDGKGQARLDSPDNAQSAWQALAGRPAVLEGFVPFECEISVIAARGQTGEIACFDPGENQHQNGILRQTTVPARVTRAYRSDAVIIAGKILNALDYVGVLGVELFVTRSGLVVNEIAPRVHNSGHWTQNGCLVDQFEQHIRAIAGLPLADGQRIADVEMHNLLGDDVHDLTKYLTNPKAALHLYGKQDAKPGRKMGHVNIIKT